MSDNTIPVVFVHGAGGSAAVWRNQLTYLSGKYRPLAIDLPGHAGASGEAQPSMDYYADAVERFIAAHEAARPVLVGHSMGGGVIQTVALRNPAAYRGLVLVGTGARLRVAPAMLEKLQTDFRAALDMADEVKWAPTTDPALKAEFRRLAEQTTANVHWSDMTACDRFDVMARLKELALPAIAIVGAEDKLTPPKYAQFLQQSLPACTIEIIPGAGHMVQLEQPAAFNRALAAFMVGVE